MKTAKLLELVENTNTFSEAYDLMNVFYESKDHNFHMSRSQDGWLCKIKKVKKVVNGKDVEYKESFVLQEMGNTFIEAIKNGARAILK